MSNLTDEDFKNYLGNIDIKDHIYKNCMNNSFIDGDENIAYIQINKNEPTRVLHGMNTQYNNLHKYLFDEMEEMDKNSNWWGQHEY